MAVGIPRPFIDALIDRTDIVSLIDKYVPLKKQGNSFVACCPFHHEKSPSFHVIPSKQFYHCFGCGANGNAIGFLMEYRHHSFLETIDVLATQLGMTVPKDGVISQKPKVSGDLYALLEQVNTWYRDRMTASAIQTYVQHRGIDANVMARYELGYAPDGWHGLETAFRAHDQGLLTTGMLVAKDNGKTYDRYRNRLMFPIRDKQGRIVGFGGRVIEKDASPKYLNSPETPLFQKGHVLYGLFECIRENKALPYVIVVEGYLDVIALAQYGLPYAVATLGTAITPHHIRLLMAYTQRIIFCFDGDAAGEKAAWKAVENSLPFLNQGIDTRFIFLPSKQDPDSFVRTEGKEAFLKCIEHALPLNQWLLNSIASSVDMQTVAGKTQFLRKCFPYLEKITPGPYYQLLLDDLSYRTHIDSQRILEWMGLKKADTPVAPAPSVAANQKTPIRNMIGILLASPYLYLRYQEAIQELITNHPEGLEDPDFSADLRILADVVEAFRQGPEFQEMKTGMLLEYMRDMPIFTTLSSFISWNIHLEETQKEAMLLDMLHFVRKQILEHQINQYIKRSRQQTLSLEDRSTLQKLLKEKQSIHLL